jgi:hypothetical protein
MVAKLIDMCEESYLRGSIPSQLSRREVADRYGLSIGRK